MWIKCGPKEGITRKNKLVKVHAKLLELATFGFGCVVYVKRSDFLRSKSSSTNSPSPPHKIKRVSGWLFEFFCNKFKVKTLCEIQFGICGSFVRCHPQRFLLDSDDKVCRTEASLFDTKKIGKKCIAINFCASKGIKNIWAKKLQCNTFLWAKSYVRPWFFKKLKCKKKGKNFNIKQNFHKKKINFFIVSQF